MCFGVYQIPDANRSFGVSAGDFIDLLIKTFYRKIIDTIEHLF